MAEKKQLDKVLPGSNKTYERQIHTLPIGIANIERVLASGYYEDKTAYAGQMFIQGIPLFLIRPRRFGKTLFIDTLATIAQGAAKKELFKDCFIYKGIFKNEHGVAQTYDWKQYPVIRLDFSELSHETPDLLKDSLKRALVRIAAQYVVSIETPTMKDGFKNLYTQSE
jgi:hypothetical protein